MSDVTARKGEPTAKKADAWRRKRAAEVLSLSTLVYASEVNYRQVYQAVYKSSTFSKRWSPRKLSSEEVDALRSGLASGAIQTQRKSLRRGRTCGALNVKSDVDHAEKPENVQVRRNDEEEPSRMQRDPEKTYYTMLLEKSRELKLKEEKTHLTLKNTSLRRDLSEIRANTRNSESNRTTRSK